MILWVIRRIGADWEGRSDLDYTGLMNEAKLEESPDDLLDGKRRFLFEDLDARGELVHLRGVLDEVSAIHAYPEPVHRLLGEFMAAAVLLASNLKFEGSLTVQARSDRQIPLIMAECTNNMSVRAIARGAQEAMGTSFSELLGDGQLVLTITPTNRQRYQGIVPLQSASLAQCIDSYFAQSEQLGTRIFLCCSGRRAAGLLLQQLPVDLDSHFDTRKQNFERLALLSDTLRPEELLGLKDAELLTRLFSEDSLRLFDPEPVRFKCSCSAERTLQALASLGAEEIRDILDEQGMVTMDCEFCNQRYTFNREQLRHLIEKPVH
ncbi:MAG: Hsp33 family molecular chaperone HslO [Pseudomonadota bacterium]